MSELMRTILVSAMIIILAVVLSYTFALIGEPQSAWLWCEKVKAC